MWERFCFYGMRGVLIYFMVDQLLLNEGVANLQYGATQAFVYAFTFVGGLFADKALGYRKSLFWGGILMIIGSCILAFDPIRFFLRRDLFPNQVSAAWPPDTPRRLVDKAPNPQRRNTGRKRS